MIDLTVNREQMKINAKLCKEKGIILPTFENMRNPKETVPQETQDALKDIGIGDVDSKNLFRVTWANEPNNAGGGYGETNYIEIPSELTGVKARIIAMVGKWFPTGAHKVGPAYSCIIPSLVTGQFDPTKNMAVWPSTGNYCRGGAYISRLLGCPSIAILPEEMSKERFDWLEKMADETIATPGCESNVKEIFDKCWELMETREKLFIYNQFDQMANPMWHYSVTGYHMEKVLKKEMGPNQRLAGACFTSGSAGTMATGDYLKSVYPHVKIGVGEALQCPTLLDNGFGGHRIEGIGDKHVPWVHNIRNTDMVIALDDEHAMRTLRLFNEGPGRDLLTENGVSKNILDKIDWLGISSIGNLMSCIKMAKYYELTEDDVVVTLFTDSASMYQSRLQELSEARGQYSRDNAIADFEVIKQLTTDNLLETTYASRKRIHNLKYYTWVEQQQKDVKDLNRQWYDETAWTDVWNSMPKVEKMINEFNELIRQS